MTEPNQFTEYDDLGGRTEQSYQTKDFDAASAIFKPQDQLPEGTTFWRDADGEHYVEIIPWRAGRYDPNRPAGASQYFLDVYVHYSVGSQAKAVLCLAKTYGKAQPAIDAVIPLSHRRCAICEYGRQLRAQKAAKEDLEAFRPKRRSIYQVLVLDNEDEIAKGVQIWDASHFGMEKNLIEQAHDPVTNSNIPFSHPSQEKGRMVYFKRIKKGDFAQWESHKLLVRDRGIEPEILAQAHPLDEMIVIPTPEEVYELFYDRKLAPGESLGDASGALMVGGKAVPRPAASATRVPPTRAALPQPAAPAAPATRRPVAPLQAAPAAPATSQAAEFYAAETLTGGLCPAGGVFGRDHNKLGEACESCPKETFTQCLAAKVAAPAAPATAAPSRPAAAPTSGTMPRRPPTARH